MFSMVSYVYFRTPNLEELVFGTLSNFDTSGGFGPNQVATMIGFGAFILGVFLFIRVNLSVYIFLDGIFLTYFVYRGLLTFSRGGMITAGIAFIIFSFDTCCAEIFTELKLITLNPSNGNKKKYFQLD